jgi:O-antigen/teichoic acid export membrane protein
MNGSFYLATVLILVGMGLHGVGRINDSVFGIAIGTGVAFSLVGLFQLYRGKEAKSGPARYGLFVFAVILIVVAVAVQDRLGNLLPLALGIGTAFGIVGLFEMFGRKKPKQSESARSNATRPEP